METSPSPLPGAPMTSASPEVAPPCPANEDPKPEESRSALDDLFDLTRKYRQSKDYKALLDFVARFRFYSPFNAVILNMQMPGATFVATPRRWMKKYGRNIVPGARPLVILQPKGPVLFVYDAADTDGKTLPPEVTGPFEPRHGSVGRELDNTLRNAPRDGICVHESHMGSQSAGMIAKARPDKQTTKFENKEILVRYEMVLNKSLSPTARYATLVHELAHLYCGHLGCPTPGWWPDRHNLEADLAEFEAESVAYLVCFRLGVCTPSETYLANFVKEDGETPKISLDCVLKAVALIENMGKGLLPARK